MKARRLFEESAFDPPQLKVIFKAFDDAWEQIARGVSSNPDAVQAARTPGEAMAMARPSV